MSMDEDAVQRQLQALWVHVTSFVKKTIATPNPTLFIAMDAAKALVLDGNDLILGIEASQFHLAATLEQLGVKSTIEKALTGAARGEMHYRVIQGETPADWRELQERERQAREMAAARPKQPTREAGTPQSPVLTRSWEEALTQVHRLFGQLRIKTIAQARARYVLDMMPYVFQTEEQLNPTGHGALEDRGLAHVLEKIAQLAEVDTGTVALEYLRYRDTHRPQAPSTSSDQDSSASSESDPMEQP